MRPLDTNQGAADGSAAPFLAAPARAWRMIVEALAVLGTVMIGILGLIICADIVARNSMGASLPLVSEMGALLLVMIVALQLATTIRADRLARTEFIFETVKQFAPRVGALMAALFNLAGAWMLGLIAWSTVDVLVGDWEAAEFIGIVGIATLPTWPFRALILLGFAVAAIEFLVRALADLRSMIGDQK